MPEFLTIIKCELCSEEHVLRVPSGESVNSFTNNKPNFPIHYIAMIGGSLRKNVCEKCRQLDVALRAKQEAERKEFLKI